MHKSPIWIKEDIVLAIHQRQISEHGGGNGIRDKTLLESALRKPQDLYTYGNPSPSLIELSASYAYGIIKNHPFVNGNKRTAYVVCETFLLLNNFKLHASDQEKYQTFLGLSDGNISQKELVHWLTQK